MKPPFTSITVDGEIVKVRWLKDLGRFPQGYSRGGDYGGGTIRVVTTTTRAGMRAAFTHELLHYCVERGGGVKAGLPRTQNEEAFIDSADSFLYHALRDNPDMVAWLTEDLT